MHIGAVLASRPAPSYDEFVEHIEARLHPCPGSGRSSFPPLQAGKPVWVDDPRLNSSTTCATLAAGLGRRRPARDADREALLAAARPLEAALGDVFVQGLEDNRFALISKTHHALVDGVSGVDLATVLFDANPVPAGLTPPVRPWEPQPEPSELALVARGVENVARMPCGSGAGLVEAAQHPRRAAAHAVSAAEGIGEIAWELLEPGARRPPQHADRLAPPVRVGPFHLDDFKVVKNAFGGTVNDVVLAVVAGALRGWLQHRGVRTPGPRCARSCRSACAARRSAA